jgi:tRNA (mo5U34)-methyltransferase
MRDTQSRSLTDEVQSFSWFHSIDLGDGLVTPGHKPLSRHVRETKTIFSPLTVFGKTVLDIGAWNGFYSLEAKRRGATRVVAADHYVWHRPEFGLKRAIEIPIEATGLDIEPIDVDVPDLTLEKTGGPFDIVLFLGVFYHLIDPIDGLRRAAEQSREVLVVESHIETSIEDHRPCMVFFPDGFANDATNCWGPNAALIVALLQRFGFPRVDHMIVGTRAFFHAWR